ncbi:MAG TPA: universal stress protein [Thermoplasmata archaeon]|nr:universal stress protein [Thermoplasmata archaeon]
MTSASPAGGASDPARRLVVAFDGSAPATRALGFALRLAGRTGGRIWAVHIVGAPAAIAEPRTEEEQRTEPDAIASALRAVQATAAKDGVALEVLVLEGNAAEAILATARKVEADLIVVGTRGLRGASRFFLGSVSAAVLAGAGRPVVVVP